MQQNGSRAEEESSQMLLQGCETHARHKGGGREGKRQNRAFKQGLEENRENKMTGQNEE